MTRHCSVIGGPVLIDGCVCVCVCVCVYVCVQLQLAQYTVQRRS